MATAQKVTHERDPGKDFGVFAVGSRHDLHTTYRTGRRCGYLQRFGLSAA